MTARQSSRSSPVRHWCSLCLEVPHYFRTLGLIFSFTTNTVQKPWSSSACAGQLWALPAISLVGLLPWKCFFSIIVLQIEICWFLSVCFQIRYNYYMPMAHAWKLRETPESEIFVDPQVHNAARAFSQCLLSLSMSSKYDFDLFLTWLQVIHMDFLLVPIILHAVWLKSSLSDQ